MVAALEMSPGQAGLTTAPWPPASPNKRPIPVSATDSFETVAERAGCSFAELVKLNFEIDIGAPALKGKWPKVLNYYLRTKLNCTRMTPGGNYKFSGGETLYGPEAPKKTPIKYESLDTNAVIEWFKSEIIPKRTDPAGTNINRMKYWGQYSNPNGLCGAASQFVKENEPPRLSGIQIGFVLWQSKKIFTHIGNVILPANFRVGIFNNDDGFTDETPERYRPLHSTWPSISRFPVLDLYFKKVSTVEQWWRDVSYSGWGTLTLDYNGQFINDAD